MILNEAENELLNIKGTCSKILGGKTTTTFVTVALHLVCKQLEKTMFVLLIVL